MKKVRGFTLLEVVIALAIFAVGLVGLLSLFPVSFQVSKRASDLTEATIYAQEKIEDLKRQGYDNITVGSQTNQPISGTTRFTYDLVITETAGLKEITLTINYTEGGKSYSEDFVAYMAYLTP